MVIGAFPVAKLSVLLIKQISKPIANICKERAKNHPFFRTYVCMPPAQFYNWCEVKLKMWILNLGKPVNIPVLSQDMAIELGANLLGEGVIFGIGAGLLIFEYNRQTNKEAAKEEKRLQEMSQITETVHDLYFTLQRQETQLREMERMVYSLTGKPVKPVPEPERPPKDPPTVGPTAGPAPGAAPSDASVKGTPVSSTIRVAEPSYVLTFDTPYPDRGIILQALNYVQMDVLHYSVATNEMHSEPNHTPSNARRRDQGVISEALDNIENELKSLF